MSSIYKNLAFLGAVLGNYGLFRPVFRLFRTRYPTYADPGSKVCIEGFPRSGNTFFVSAIRCWNPQLAISHHSHLASSAKYLSRRGVPTVILIREPVAAVSSAMVWDGKLLATVGLIAYISFYRSLRKFWPELLVLGFEECTQAPDIAVQKINSRYGTELNWVEYGPSESESLRRRLERLDTRNNRNARNSTLPNEEKNALKQVCATRVRESPLLVTAQRLYDSIEVGGG